MDKLFEAESLLEQAASIVYDTNESLAYEIWGFLRRSKAEDTLSAPPVTDKNEKK